jgi:hypothetical protein
MAKRKADTRQLGFEFTMPPVITPVPAWVREIFKPEALPTFPLHRPGSAEEAEEAEEAEAIAAIPFGQRWENYVAVGAVPERIEVALPRKNRLTLSITGTRLGWTAGYMLTFRRPVGLGANSRAGTGHFGSCSGGGLHADVDEHGFYLWTSRSAAIGSAGHQAWLECRSLDATLADEIERSLWFPAFRPPSEKAKRRLVSRADGDASLERRRSQPHDAIPESPAIDEYRRAAGLSDTRAWRTAA